MILASLALLAQLSGTCNPKSADNGTLYVPVGCCSIKCMEWDQAKCAYVERPCDPAELVLLCRLIPPACPYVQPKRILTPPRQRRK